MAVTPVPNNSFRLMLAVTASKIRGFKRILHAIRIILHSAATPALKYCE